MIAVYFRARNQSDAEALLQRLRDGGHAVRPANAEYFDPDQLEPVEAVYHDGTELAIPEAYSAAGIPCQRIGGEPTPEPEPEPAETEDGYTVEQAGSWHKLIGPDGMQVGKSQRSEEDAWALLEDSD